MSKNKKRKNAKSYVNKTSRLIGVVFLLSFIFGIGYANITAANLSITGVATSSGQTGVVISDVTYLSNTYGNVSNSNINTYYQTMMDSTIALTDNYLSTITYQVTITNLGNYEKEFQGVQYDAEFYDNEDIDFEITGLTIGDLISANETKVVNITFKYKEQKAHYENTVLNSYLNFKFDSPIIEEYKITSLCEFHGEGNDIVGDCANGQHIDYINTGISLFSAENRNNDFEISFEVDSIDPSRFRSGKVDTIFNCLNDATPYPGIVFRIENSKWYLQVGTGVDNKKLYWNPSDIQAFKLKKVNNKVYYSINNGPDVYVDDLSTIPIFNDSLTIGASLLPNGTPVNNRFLIANLSNFYLRVLEPGNQEEPEIRTYATVDQEIADFMEEPMTVAFSSSGQHVFDGINASIIDTGVELLSSTNYQKSFVVTFTIDSFTKTGQAYQATLFNIKDESNNNYPGLMIRLSGDKYELAMKDGIGTVASVNIPLTANRINIIKKGMEMYYQVDLEVIKPLGNSNDFTNYPLSNTFNIPATFGCNINGSGNYDRIIKGTLSDMIIKVPANNS